MNLPQVAAHTAGIFQAWMGGIADVPAQTPEELALKSSGQGHRDRKGHVAETGHPAAVPIPGQTDPVMWDQCALSVPSHIWIGGSSLCHQIERKMPEL